MTLRRLSACCDCRIVWMPDNEPEITHAYTSDLLSDVMAHCPDGAVLITIQNHPNTVAVATLTGACAILIAHQRDIPPEMLRAAEREQVAILQSSENQFTLSCRVGAALGLNLHANKVL